MKSQSGYVTLKKNSKIKNVTYIQIKVLATGFSMPFYLEDKVENL